ncbi:2-octaprenyl-6-methoxyphenol hydroxylase [Candidatus Hartigia pinicola]|nr:2-octaprenyl-6-methoxyphenol hydroxylase [Candidatus Hartigia pinicola]
MTVIISGGGMVGATLALAISSLSQGKLSVTLIEASLPFIQRSEFCSRAIALAYGTYQRLSKINIWKSLADCVIPITHVHVSERGSVGFVNINAQDYCISALGYVIELQDAIIRLFALLRQAPGVTLYCPAKVEKIHRTIDGVIVMLDNSEVIKGKLLVAADGTYSAVRKNCHMQYQQDNYGQVAIIANINTAIDPKGKAFEHFTEYGPLALLPLSQGRSFLVWCYKQEQVDVIKSWDDEIFIYKLQEIFGWRLGKIIQTGTRCYYPLSLRIASNAISHRIVLVGDAAQTLHPIAGQGFNLAMRDVMQLAESIVLANQKGLDVGAYSLLYAYQKARALDREKTIMITDYLVRLFSNRFLPLVVGRNLGLMIMEMLPLVRNVLAYQTLGWVEHK